MPRPELVRRSLNEVMNALPPVCFAVSPADNKTIVVIERGVSGFHDLPAETRQRAQKQGISPMDVDAMNGMLAVTPAQARAMIAGSMFGFDVPGADPLNNEKAPDADVFKASDR